MTQDLKQCEGSCDLKPTAKKVQMWTEPGCPNCATAKDLLKNKIDSHQIEVIDESNPLHKQLEDKFHLEKTPAFIVNNVKVCKLNGTTEKFDLLCEDGSREEI